MTTIKATATEIENYPGDFLSDMDYGLNKETGEYTVPALEVDGAYGKHWIYFETEQDRGEYIDRLEEEFNYWVIEYREEQKAIKAAKRAEALRIKNMKTLGSLEVLIKLREEFK